jgi:hypothetical protein
MSRFTKKVAARIVLKAVRSDRKNPSELPLRGMETSVLKALRYAEYVHALALYLVSSDEQLHKRLKASRRKRAKVSEKVQASKAAWEALTEQERFDLVWAAEPIPSSKIIEWVDRPVTHIKPIVDWINANLNEMNLITIRKLTWARGRRRYVSQPRKTDDKTDDKMTNLIPLIAFAKALKAFWEPATNGKFGQQFDEDKKRLPVSAALNFVAAAMPYLRRDYTLTHVKTVMIGIQKEGWIREDDQFRQEVAEVCNLNSRRDFQHCD